MPVHPNHATMIAEYMTKLIALCDAAIDIDRSQDKKRSKRLGKAIHAIMPSNFDLESVKDFVRRGAKLMTDIVDEKEVI